MTIRGTITYEVWINPTIGNDWDKCATYCATYKDLEHALSCARELFRDYINDPRCGFIDVRIKKVYSHE
jgi:hypothetical protein